MKRIICGKFFYCECQLVLYTTTLCKNLSFPSSDKIVCHSCSIRDLHCKTEKHISTFRDVIWFVAVNGNDMYTCKIKCLHFWIWALGTTCRKASALWLCFYFTYRNLVQASKHPGISLSPQRASKRLNLWYILKKSSFLFANYTSEG